MWGMHGECTIYSDELTQRGRDNGATPKPRAGVTNLETTSAQPDDKSERAREYGRLESLDIDHVYERLRV